jgi:hypothetical protein
VKRASVVLNRAWALRGTCGGRELGHAGGDPGLGATPRVHLSTHREGKRNDRQGDERAQTREPGANARRRIRKTGQVRRR